MDDPDSHRYWDKYGFEYMSLSRKFKEFVPHTNFEMIKGFVAKAAGVTKEEIQADWDAKKDSSILGGNRIHKACENYVKLLKVEPEHEDLRPMIKSLAAKIFVNYKRLFAEQIFSSENKLAGTSDLVCQHKKQDVYIDIWDYKTNEQKGIQFEDKYYKYLLPPLEHLTNCNYHEYTIKLSVYARMAELEYGYKIGRLGIIFIPIAMPEAWHTIPMPYMKNEADYIIKNHDRNALIIK